MYTGGLQYIGFYNQMITYPATQQILEFSDASTADSKPLSTRTKEGLALKIHVAFQYQLIKNELPQLYRLAGTNYLALYRRLAADVILQEAGNYDAPQYWQQRVSIGKKLEESLKIKLFQAHANVTGFMILKIDLPDSYEEAIVDTQIVNQEIITQQLIMQVNLINTGIEVDRARTAKNVTITNAEADGNATQIANTAKSTIISNTVNQQKVAYSNSKSLLSIGTNKELLDYIFYLNV